MQLNEQSSMVRLLVDSLKELDAAEVSVMLQDRLVNLDHNQALSDVLLQKSGRFVVLNRKFRAMHVEAVPERTHAFYLQTREMSKPGLSDWRQLGIFHEPTVDAAWNKTLLVMSQLEGIL